MLAMTSNATAYELNPFTLPDNDGHPADIAARLMRLPEHAALAEYDVEFGWLMRADPKFKGGKFELGSVHAVQHMAQGAFKDLFEMMLERLLGTVPAYVIVLNAEWWRDASAREREALIYHELCHVRHAVDKFGELKFDRDGKPVFAIVEHDVTAFNAEVERYGTWTSDIDGFVKSANK